MELSALQMSTRLLVASEMWMHVKGTLDSTQNSIPGAPGGDRQGKGVAEKAQNPPLALGVECGCHPEHVELKGSLSGWMAAWGSFYQGDEEGNSAALPGKGKIYLSHAQDAGAKPGLILIS